MTSKGGRRAGKLRPHHPHLVLAICCASVVVAVLDIAAVNVALPAIRRDLHASIAGLQWTVDAYVDAARLCPSESVPGRA